MNFKKYLTYSLVVGSLTLTSVTYTGFSDYDIIKNSQVHAAQVGNAQVSNWAKPYVEAMKNGGLIPASLQSGNLAQNITREEFAELITTYVNKTGKKFERNENTQFSDTQNPLVKEAARLGIVAGIGNGKFAPKQHTNREQIATMAFRGEEIASLVSSTRNVSKFSDTHNISEWAKLGVGTMVREGAIEGTGNGMFKPKDSATKEQAIKIVAELAAKKGMITINKPAPAPTPKPEETAPSTGTGLMKSGFKYSSLTLSGNVKEVHHGLKIPTEIQSAIMGTNVPHPDTGKSIAFISTDVQSYKGGKRYELSWALAESTLKSFLSESIANQILDYGASKQGRYDNLTKKVFTEGNYNVTVVSPTNRSDVIMTIRLN